MLRSIFIRTVYLTVYFWYASAAFLHTHATSLALMAVGMAVTVFGEHPVIRFLGLMLCYKAGQYLYRELHPPRGKS